MLGFATYLSIQLTTYQNSARNQKVTFVKGTDGKPGATIIGPIGDIGPRGYKGDKGDSGESIQGPKGDKGEDGQSIVGPKGNDGTPAPPAREIELCYMSDGTTLGQRYVGDTTCKVITKADTDQGTTEETVSWGQ